MWDYRVFRVKFLDQSYEASELAEIIQLTLKNKVKIYLWRGKYHVSFESDGDKFHPLEGSSSVLNEIIITPLNVDGILKLLTKDKVFDFDRLEVEGFDEEWAESNIDDKGLFDKINVVKHFNYSQIIDNLEEEEYVRTTPSSCLIATDPRRFTILEKAGKEIPELIEYKNSTYDVDCLGSSLFIDLTDSIIDLRKKIEYGI